MAPISDIERATIMLADPMRHRYAGWRRGRDAPAFAPRWRAERGLPALPEAAEPYREGEWANYRPDLSGEPARAGRSWMGLLGNGALAAGCFWVAAKLLI